MKCTYFMFDPRRDLLLPTTLQFLACFDHVKHPPEAPDSQDWPSASNSFGSIHTPKPSWCQSCPGLKRPPPFLGQKRNRRNLCSILARSMQISDVSVVPQESCNPTGRNYNFSYNIADSVSYRPARYWSHTKQNGKLTTILIHDNYRNVYAAQNLGISTIRFERRFNSSTGHK